MSETKAEHVKAQLAEFRAKLETFAAAHRDDVRTDPSFRAQFHAMCASVGVDPLASSKGAWSAVLGFGDYYAEVAVAVVEACLASRPLDGGLTDLATVLAYVRRRRGGAADPVSEDDVVRAVGALAALGNGFAVARVGAARVVRSVPGALSSDGSAVLELAGGRGWATASQLEQGLGWPPARAAAALGGLLAEGVALADDPPGGGERRHWFPCLGLVSAGGGGVKGS